MKPQSQFPGEYVGSGAIGGMWRGIEICGKRWKVIASRHGGWDHVSISRDYGDLALPGHEHELPTWPVMAILKDLFFEPHEIAFQIHPPKHVYVNRHPGVLHLWRSQSQEMVLPDPDLV